MPNQMSDFKIKSDDRPRWRPSFSKCSGIALKVGIAVGSCEQVIEQRCVYTVHLSVQKHTYNIFNIYKPYNWKLGLLVIYSQNRRRT